MTLPPTAALPRSLLIANRGEIALRIARTCRSLGIRSVAVHSALDRDAPHVAACDAAVALRGTDPAAGYLDGGQLVAVAKAAGAEALHPGYGFLAENAAFAEACAAAGLLFVGPSPAAIRRMGDKIAAKQLAAAAGVPVLPGVAETQSAAAAARDAGLLAAARDLAFPLLVKASAGGGGKGMRLAQTAGDLPEALALARQEAAAAFGDDRLLLEHFVARARHIEVQVFGDRHGNLVHLFERDCSIQRRHQKLVEEAPAPALREDTRAALHAAALTLARSVGYDNAGTVEFVLDADSEAFFFLEMNTRLQVEHPVTEAVTGLDLVEWQLRAAAGQPLPLRQEAITLRGAAVEVRLVAEDPAAEFRPQGGRLALLEVVEGPGLRFDAGVRSGQEIVPAYDSLLGKLIAWGPDRPAAVARLGAALRQSSLLGLASSLPLLAAIADEPGFGRGGVTTGYLAAAFPGGWRPVAEPLDCLAAALALAGTSRPDGGPRQSGPWSSLGAWRLGGGGEGRSACVLIDEEGARSAWWLGGGLGHPWLQAFEGGARLAATAEGQDGQLVLAAEGRPRRYRVLVEQRPDGRRVFVSTGGRGRHFLAPDGADAWRQAGVAAAGEGLLRAPCPGLVASVAVALGERVEAGQPLVVLESMKLFQTLTAPRGGRVAALPVKAGQAVAQGAPLAEIAMEDEAGRETP